MLLVSAASIPYTRNLVYGLRSLLHHVPEHAQGFFQGFAGSGNPAAHRQTADPKYLLA